MHLSQHACVEGFCGFGSLADVAAEVLLRGAAVVVNGLVFRIAFVCKLFSCGIVLPCFSFVFGNFFLMALD